MPHVHVSFFGVLLTLPDLSADRPLPSPAPHADPHARCHGGIAQLSQLYAPWPTDQLFRLSLHYQGLLPRRAAASDDERRSVLSAASAVLRRGTDRSAPPVPPPELA